MKKSNVNMAIYRIQNSVENLKVLLNENLGIHEYNGPMPQSHVGYFFKVDLQVFIYWFIILR